MYMKRKRKDATVTTSKNKKLSVKTDLDAEASDATPSHDSESATVAMPATQNLSQRELSSRLKVREPAMPRYEWPKSLLVRKKSAQENPFTCFICKKRLADQSAWELHLFAHYAKNIYQCQFCVETRPCTTNPSKPNIFHLQVCTCIDYIMFYSRFRLECATMQGWETGFSLFSR